MKMTGSFEFLKNYDGKIKVNGEFVSGEQVSNIDLMDSEEIEIELIPRCLCDSVQFYITVRAWMANDSGNLDFHQRWNNGIPMPSREIKCKILGESPGMYKVDGVCSNGRHWVGYISKAAIIEMKEI